MNVAEFHYIASCVAGFSFLSTAVFTAYVHVPHTPLWRRLRWCRTYMSMIFMVVALATGKTVFFNLPPNPLIIQTSTLISSSLQALLFACTGITFIAPRYLLRRRVKTHLAIIIANAVQLITVMVFFRTYAYVSLALGVCVYLTQMVIYVRVFFRLYAKCVAEIDSLTDEDSEGRLRWVKRFYIAVSSLGFSACVAPFLPVVGYDCWMLGAAVFYGYVLLQFVNYWNSTAQLMSRVYAVTDDFSLTPSIEQPQEVETTENQDTTPDYSELEKRLQQWVEDRGFVNNDLVSESLAQSMGVNIATFRSYFRNTGKTDFRQWRMKLRIDYACHIMERHPDYTYDTVAEMTGICDRSNFLRTFRKITGMSPKEYLCREVRG